MLPNKKMLSIGPLKRLLRGQAHSVINVTLFLMEVTT